MKNKADTQKIQAENSHILFPPTITTISVPVLFGRGEKTESTYEETHQPKRKKPKSRAVAKYEVSEGVLKFFDAKGFPKKRWALIKEIPISEVSNVENFGNELNITWNGVVYSFVLKKKSESFSELRDQIRGLLEQQQKTEEITDQASLRKIDLTGLVNVSIGIVDLTFDILMGLHEKRIDWMRLEGSADKLGRSWNFTSQTVAPLNLDFEKVSAAIGKQIPKEVAKETFIILKSIYTYFEGLKPADMEKVHFQNAKLSILAYYTLNDLLFGKVIGEKDSRKESLALEDILLSLANESNVKVNFEELQVNMDRLDAEMIDENTIEEARAIFKKKLGLSEELESAF
ncbi:MAG TPA: hypothetical protein VK253_08075 [Candidatus Binatia bacterium]|nr:hypothetical protein [Candidatus Binatia bacterium]